jgi:hypothetical protein
MGIFSGTYLELLCFVNDFETVYSIIEEGLSSQTFSLHTENSDGRDNSRLDEGVISEYLTRTFTGVRRGVNRDIGDVWLGNLPINIKVVEDRPTQANNLVGSTSFVKYVFNASRCHTTVEIARTLVNTPLEQELRKYGLIILTKETNRVWVGNFDEIPMEHIRINPSNGIQITWPFSKVSRTNEEYRDLMKKKMLELMEKWAEPLKVYESLVHNEQGVGTILHDQ